MRWPWPVVIVLLVGAAWIMVGTAIRPLGQTCDPALSHEVCLETIDAALRKGMPGLHPLLLGATAEPGPAARPDQFGHRATVTFDALAMPGPTSVRLFFDAGGHWGGIASRDAVELGAWAVAQAALVAGVAAGVLGWRGRRPRPGPPDERR